jgi:hypothetical protein
MATALRFGEPPDVPGECNARLYIGDNFADNHATMRCRLAPKHTGKHREEYMPGPSQRVVVEWDLDERRDEEDD